MDNKQSKNTLIVRIIGTIPNIPDIIDETMVLVGLSELYECKNYYYLLQM